LSRALAYYFIRRGAESKEFLEFFSKNAKISAGKGAADWRLAGGSFCKPGARKTF
jgi:hypothetical protein